MKLPYSEMICIHSDSLCLLLSYTKVKKGGMSVLLHLDVVSVSMDSSGEQGALPEVRI